MTVTVTDPAKPARVSARGGDSISEGWGWGEDHEWIPGHGWIQVTRDAPDPAPADREGRIAWCNRATPETGAALIAHATEAAAAKTAWAKLRAAEKKAWAAQDAAQAAMAKAAKAKAAARAIAARIAARRACRAGGPGRCL